MALEDREWEKADGFFEEVLNQNAQCAEAYLGKLLASTKQSNTNSLSEYYKEKYNKQETEELEACEEATEVIEEAVSKYAILGYLKEKEIRDLFVYDRSYTSGLSYKTKQKESTMLYMKQDKLLQRTLQYATGETKAAVEEMIKNVEAELDRRIEVEQKQDKESIESVKVAYAKHLEEAELKAVELHRKTVERQESEYVSRVAKMNSASTEEEYQILINCFKAMCGYKDTKELAEKCQQEIERIWEEEQKEKERREAEIKSYKEKAAKKKKKKIIVGVSVTAVAILVLVLWTNVINPAMKKSEAESFVKEGKYTEAIEIYKDLGDAENEKECKYKQAQSFVKEGKYTEAYDTFCSIIGYKDVDEILKNDINMLEEKKFQVGNQVDFGKYKWTVLERKNGKVLLITTDCVEEREYNEEAESITWENCTLRKYLNNEFYNQFNEEEKSQIVKTKVINNDNSTYRTAGGNDTEDNIFLLSIDEANKYFKSDDERIANYDGEAAWWWLRSPGRSDNYAAYVNYGGDVINYGWNVNSGNNAIRPALWINLES